MANNLTVKIGADITGLEGGTSKANQRLGELAEKARQAASSLSEMSGVSNGQVAAIQAIADKFKNLSQQEIMSAEASTELENAIAGLAQQYQNLSNVDIYGDMGQTISAMKEEAEVIRDAGNQVKAFVATQDQATNKSKTAKAQLNAMTRQITELEIRWRGMTDAERESAEGRALADKMSVLKDRASELKDTIGDVKSEIAALASDTSNLDAFNQVLSITGNGMSTFASLIATATGNEEDFKAAMATFTTVQSAVNSVTAISNALQSSSIVMAKIRAIKEIATAKAIAIKATAEATGTKATKSATIAQAAFNVVANANPYVLLATAVLTAGAAIYALTKYLKTGSEEGVRMSESMTKLNNELQKTDVTGRETAITFNNLATIWNNTKSLQNRQNFLKTYSEQLKKTGLNIKSVQDAEQAFSTQGIKYFANYIKAKIKMEMQEQKINKMVHDLAIWQLKKEQAQRELAQSPTYDNLKRLGPIITQANAQIANNEKGLEAGLKRMQLYGQEYAKAAKYVKLDEKKTSTKSPKATRTASPQTSKQEDELFKSYDRQIEAIKAKIANTNNQDERVQLMVDLRLAQDSKRALELQLKSNEYIQEIKAGIKVDDKDLTKVFNELLSLQSSFAAMGEKGEKAFTQVSQAAQKMALKIATANSSQALSIDKLFAKYNDYNREKTESDRKMLDDANKAASEAVEQMNQKETEKQQARKETLEKDKENAQEMFSSLGDLYSNLGSLIGGTTGEIIGKVGQLAQAFAQAIPAILNMAFALTAENAAMIPPPGNIIAIASGVAAIIGLIAQMKSATESFATGGIIGGNSYVRDTTPVMAHRGEMILNTNQQSRLFRMLDSPVMATGNNMTSGDVTFKIQGQTLVGVLKNYNNKQNRIL